MNAEPVAGFDLDLLLDVTDPSRQRRPQTYGEAEGLRRQLAEKDEELERLRLARRCSPRRAGVQKKLQKLQKLTRAHEKLRARRDNDVASLAEELAQAEDSIDRLNKRLRATQKGSDGSKKRAARDATRGDETERLSGTDDSEATATGEAARGSTPVDAPLAPGFDVVRVAATLFVGRSTKRKHSLVVSAGGARQTSELATQTSPVPAAAAAAVPAPGLGVVRVVATPAPAQGQEEDSTRKRPKLVERDAVQAPRAGSPLMMPPGVARRPWPPRPPMPPDGDITKRLERMPCLVAMAFILPPTAEPKGRDQRKSMLLSLFKLAGGRISSAEFVKTCKDTVGTERFDRVTRNLRFNGSMGRVEAVMDKHPDRGWPL
jgi:hypothetical protein